MVTGWGRLYVVGCYIAPGDTKTVEAVRAAWENCPRDCMPLLLGDLNANLRDPIGARAEAIADMTDEADLTDLARHFLPRGRTIKLWRRWTWRQMCRGR